MSHCSDCLLGKAQLSDISDKECEFPSFLADVLYHMLCLTALPAFHPAGVTAADSLCPARPYTPSAPKPDADRFIPAFHAFLSLKDGSLSLKPAGWSQWRSHNQSPVADSWRLCSVGAEFHDCLPAPEHHSPIALHCMC